MALTLISSAHDRDGVRGGSPAAKPSSVPHGGGLLSVEAWALVQSGAAVLVDVRTHEERVFVGHVPNSVHVPWATGTALTRNPRFVRELETKVGKSTQAVLLCRSGKRSALAMEAAGEAGVAFVVLDRPNPIGGVAMAGPVLEAERQDFVAAHTIPLRHGMTIGELARMMAMGEGGSANPAEARRLLDELPEAVMLVDHEGVVSYASPNSNSILGRPAEEWVGSTLVDLVSEANVGAGERALARPAAPWTRQLTLLAAIALALFWALLASAPVVLLNGLVAGFIGPGPALTIVGVAWVAVFVWFWLSGLRQVQRSAA